MESIETLYRNSSKGSSHYVKNLRRYIYHLVEKEKIIEAKYFFLKLHEVKPDNAQTIRLGYLISILTFDTKQASFFDKKLYELKPNTFDLAWFRFRFFYSINHKNGCEQHAKILLSQHNINDDQIDLITCFGIYQRNYYVCSTLVNFFRKNRKIFSGGAEKIIREVALSRLVDNFARIANEKFFSCENS